MNRSVIVLTLSYMTFLSNAFLADSKAQDTAKSKNSASNSNVQVTRKPSDTSKNAKNFRRVPQYFGQVGISDQQREAIYSIREKYAIRQAQLEEELASIQEKIMIDCEAVLTPAQMDSLIKLRTAAKTKSSLRSRSTTKPNTAGNRD